MRPISSHSICPCRKYPSSSCHTSGKFGRSGWCIVNVFSYHEHPQGPFSFGFMFQNFDRFGQLLICLGCIICVAYYTCKSATKDERIYYQGGSVVGHVMTGRKNCHVMMTCTIKWLKPGPLRHPTFKKKTTTKLVLGVEQYKFNNRAFLFDTHDLATRDTFIYTKWEEFKCKLYKYSKMETLTLAALVYTLTPS